MESKKKFTITIAVLAIALLISVSAMIIVIVSANQNASSAVNVKYTAEEVYVRLSANAYVGATITAFTDSGTTTGNQSIDLSPTTTTGSLSQPNNASQSINLDKTNDKVVFEYIFLNMTDSIDVKIDLTSIPATKENLDISYVYSDTKIDNVLSLTGSTTYDNQLLPAYTGEETRKYIYIIAKISNLLYSSSLEGNFEWALSKPIDSEVNVVTYEIGQADYIEREGSTLATTEIGSNYTHKTLSNSVEASELTLVPAKVDKAFVGWSETEGSDVIVSSINIPTIDNTHNTIMGDAKATTAKRLYPVYKNSSIPSSALGYNASGNYYYNSTAVTTSVTEFVIPDVCNNGNGVAKFKQTTQTNYNGGLVNDNSTIKTIYWGRYLTIIDQYAFARCSALTRVEIPTSVTSINNYAFAECSNLNEVRIGENITTLNPEAFINCIGLKSIYLASPNISSYIFAGCDNIETVYFASTVQSFTSHSIYSFTLQSVTFEDPTNWQKASNSAFTQNVENVDFSSPTANATMFNSFSTSTPIYFRKNNA